MFNTKKITIKYEKINGVYEPITVTSRHLHLRDAVAICKKFTHQANKVVIDADARLIKEIKANKNINKAKQSKLIKMIKQFDMPFSEIEKELKNA